MPVAKRSVVFDLHLVRHRLRDIIADFEDPEGRLFPGEELVDAVVRLERLIGSMINGYESDQES